MDSQVRGVRRMRVCLRAVLVLVALAFGGSLAAQDSGPLGAGDSHTCAALPGGSIKCFGHQEYNQIATGYYAGPVAEPVAVLGIANAVAMTGGYQFSCVLLQTRQIKCFGYNRWGQIGSSSCAFADGAADCSLVVGITDAIDVAAGSNHACAVLASGKVNCWGINNHGQLGLGSQTTGETNTPLEVTGISDAFAVAAGGHHSCALVGTGAVKCWGRNHVGQLGIGSITADPGVLAPADVAGITDAIAIAAGEAHTCVLRDGGGVSCWGHEDYGALGNPEDPVNDYLVSPVSVAVGDAIAVAAGDYHTCIAHAGGNVSCFGHNYYGQIGNGSNRNNLWTPQAVLGVANASALAAGGGHTCARIADDPVNVKCWGYGNRGQLGDGQFGGTNERPTSGFVIGTPFDTIFGGAGGSFESTLY